MSKPVDYSKWDHIELSDDEDDVHPNIDKESWFRMKHRSRVEREQQEEADKRKIRAEMENANQRIQVLEHDLRKLQGANDDNDDDDLDESEGIVAEIEQLKQANVQRQAKLDDYERNKTWNVDNLCHVTESRTIVGKTDSKYTPDGFVAPSEEELKAAPKEKVAASDDSVTTKVAQLDVSTKPQKESSSSTAKAAAPAKKSKANAPGPAGPPVDVSSFDTYHEFTEKYADLMEEFMKIKDLDQCKDFLIQHGNIVLQENASNYLLLASLEDEMNGFHEKMKLTARQSQIISNIAELAKSLKTHPGNVILPFFQRMQNPELYQNFCVGVTDFVEKIKARAVVKKQEIDAEREREQKDAQAQGVDLQAIPREDRLGPGGLDPLEVIETLPKEMQDAFESRDVEQLKAALLKLEPEEAERHLKRCIDSGLWVQQ